MKRIALGFGIGLVVFRLAATAGCGAGDGASAKVVDIILGAPFRTNWDADPEIDGIEFNLVPIDAQYRLVRTAGIVSAKIWLEKSLWQDGGKGDLIQQWSAIRVAGDDYGSDGAPIRLEYSGFQPGYYDYGFLEVTFTSRDGKTFGAETKVYLSEIK